jgi:hypothetical protein
MLTIPTPLLCANVGVVVFFVAAAPPHLPGSTRLRVGVEGEKRRWTSASERQVRRRTLEGGEEEEWEEKEPSRRAMAWARCCPPHVDQLLLDDEDVRTTHQFLPSPSLDDCNVAHRLVLIFIFEFDSFLITHFFTDLPSELLRE